MIKSLLIALIVLALSSSANAITLSQSYKHISHLAVAYTISDMLKDRGVSDSQIRVAIFAIAIGKEMIDASNLLYKGNYFCVDAALATLFGAELAIRW
jgi:glycosylphosphatidylinositol transamidase (GPIT) subunit GPI8